MFRNNNHKSKTFAHHFFTFFKYIIIFCLKVIFSSALNNEFQCYLLLFFFNKVKQSENSFFLMFFVFRCAKSMYLQNKRSSHDVCTTKKELPQKSSIVELPEDCIVLFFSFLGFSNATFLTFTNTCKKWYLNKRRFSSYCYFKTDLSKLDFIKDLNPLKIQLYSSVAFSVFSMGPVEVWVLSQMPQLRFLEINTSTRSSLATLSQVRSLHINAPDNLTNQAEWPPNLTHLSFCGLRFQECPSLVKLRVTSCLSEYFINKCLEEDKSQQARQQIVYSNLQVLDLSNFNYLKCVPSLSTAVSLRQLSLPSITTSSQDTEIANIIRSVHLLPCLQILEVNDLKSLAMLSIMTALTHLSCAYGLFSDINALQTLTSLEYLNLTCSIHLTDISAVAKLTNLTVLVLENLHRLHDLKPLHHHKSISLLFLRCCSNIRSTEFITLMPALTELHCLDIAFQTSENYRNLRKLRPELFPRMMSKRVMKPNFYFEG